MSMMQAIQEGAQSVDCGDGGPVYIQVVGPGQVRIGDNAQNLERNVNDGVPFTTVTNNLPQCMFYWKGLLYYIGNVSNQNGGVTFSIQIPATAKRIGQRR